MKNNFLLVFIFFFSFLALRAQTVYTILPTQADPNVVKDNSANYVMINDTIPHLNKLLLFLPGSGGIAADYTNFLKTGANMGYHTIGLNYDNDSAIGDLCLTSPPTCQGNARAEVFYGKNYSSVENVDTSESICTRLVSLLKYLEKNYPSDNWGQFLNAQDSIVWSQVCVTGHSQGAGMASLIAYWYPVYRGVFLATGGDWDISVFNVASWMEMNSLTPASKKYSFTHREDELFWGNLKEAPVIWDTLGIGSYIDFDTLSGNYYGGHSFTSYDSTGVPSGALRFHNCVGANYYTPTVSGKLLFQPLWQYMLGDTTSVATGINSLTKEGYVDIYPNPTNALLNLVMNLPGGSYSIHIANVLGQTVYAATASISGQYKTTIDLSAYPGGIYFLSVNGGNLNMNKKIVVH